jgi:alginate O-acetyltransferase complex protein AlgI
MQNFRSPYSAKDLGDFWRRWHISLSGWFRDYLYQPLGGGHKGNLQMAFNIMLVFSVSGLLHGANWTFLAWGIWDGIGLVFQRIFKQSFQVGPALSKISTLFWVFMGWFFFRVNNLEEAEVLGGKLISLPDWTLNSFNLFHSSSEMAVAISGITLLMISEKINSEEIASWFQNLSFKNSAFLFTAAIMVFLWFGHFKGGDFIYFQF